MGEDCPYFSAGYTEAELKFDDSGKVVAIAGPWNEIYEKQKPKPKPEPKIAIEEPVTATVMPTTTAAKPPADKAKDCAKLKAAADACKVNQEKKK